MPVGICLTDNPHSLQWSPFQENLLAVATSNRPGHTPISGILYFCEFLPDNQVEIAHQIQLNIGLDQLCWSHKNKSILVSTCDDFMIRFFDLRNKTCMYKEYYETIKTRSLDWDQISLEWILTAGNDEFVKLYNTMQEEDTCVETPLKHQSNVHDAQWSKHTPFHLYSCDRLGFVYLWDIKQDGDATVKWKVSNDTCGMKLDVNSFDENSLALAGFDQSVYKYDLRRPNKPVCHLKNVHSSLITDIQWSPHTQHLVATSSCDKTLRIWDMRDESGSISSFKSQKMEDFVNAIDWNQHEVGLIALCCNDHLTKVYNVRED